MVIFFETAAITEAFQIAVRKKGEPLLDILDFLLTEEPEEYSVGSSPAKEVSLASLSNLLISPILERMIAALVNPIPVIVCRNESKERL